MADSPSDAQSEKTEAKGAEGGSSPLIPILAGVIGIVVVGLLVKVMKAR